MSLSTAIAVDIGILWKQFTLQEKHVSVPLSQ